MSASKKSMKQGAALLASSDSDSDELFNYSKGALSPAQKAKEAVSAAAAHANRQS